MFFKKDKNAERAEETVIPAVETANTPEEVHSADKISENKSDAFPYSFYKPDPYPRELVSVITKLLQRMFPDTKKAYLMEAHQNNKKGYLLIVDIEPKYVKIINLYLGGETKRLIGDTPIESILYSKSGTITEGIDPFYVKETAESKANNLASKEFSGEIVFSEMPEFELWSRSDKTDEEYAKEPAPDAESAKADDGAEESQSKETAETISKETEAIEEISEAPEKEESEEINPASEAVPETEPSAEKEACKEKSQTKVKPATKQELFSLLNEYGAKKSGAISTVAMAAIREYEFYIPYSCGSDGFNEEIAESLAIDERIRFKVLINEQSEVKAVPLFTEKDSALGFALRASCSIAHIKYKDFAASRAFELTGHSGVVINPDDESIFLLSDHPLLG